VGRARRRTRGAPGRAVYEINGRLAGDQSGSPPLHEGWPRQAPAGHAL
jgi:hypothetical protein